MRLQKFSRAAGLLCLLSAIAPAQITLNPNPSRSVGHAQLAVTTTGPNLVEGRELYSPQGIAVDTDASPPILYVTDTLNNRVLAWRNAAQFSNGAPADLILGQRDKYSTLPQGPGTANSTGLNSPVGLAVKDGNLYVVDTGNNRVLRFPTPFTRTEQFPDLVIGQAGFTSRAANAGGLSARSLAFTSGNNFFRAFLTFDGQGNLWVTDPVNRRVLRYAAGDLQPGNHGPAANLVLGQPTFETPAGQNPANQLVLDHFYVPSGVAFDPGGRLYVSDSNTSNADRVGRVLVFAPPFASGVPARRVMGVVTQVPGQPPPTQDVVDHTVMLDPEAIFMIDRRPAVVETRSSRILVFDPFEQWPAETLAAPSPQASAVIGQVNFNVRSPNRAQPEPSTASLLAPVAATVAGGELFVADTENNRVLVFPQAGLGTTAARLLGQDQFRTNAPNLVEGREFRFGAGGSVDAGLVIDQNSDPPHLYVADTFNHRILGFRDVRKLKPGDRADLVIGQPDMLRAVCNYPNNDSNRPTATSLCGPTGVALDAAGNLWVADRGNGRVLRFPKPFDQAGGNMPQADLVLGQADFTTKITDPTERTMASPYGITVAGDNGILVSDAAHNRVLFFPRGADGSYRNGMAASKVFGQTGFTCPPSGCPSTGMNAPRHIASDTDGRLYVADTGNNRVLIFDQVVNAPALGALPVVTLTSGPLRAPRGIFVSPQTGEIWVTDTNGNRSLRFPRFEALLTNSASNAAIPSPIAPAALTQDEFGDLYVADGSNRVAIYYPGVAALNAANFLVNRALAPGTIASLFPLGNRFGENSQMFYDFPDPIPLRKELADIQVLVNDVASPLYAVTPEQINFVVPFSAPTSGTADVQVVRKSTGQILGSGQIQMNAASPALLTVSATGSGQVYVLNQDGTQNSPSNPAPRGSVIALFGTGQGPVPGAPPDGEGPQGLVTTPEMPRVIIGTNFVADDDVKFSGLAPDWVALWQINVRIPETVAPGNAVVVAVLYKGIPSNDPQRVRTTIAVGQ